MDNGAASQTDGDQDDRHETASKQANNPNATHGTSEQRRTLSSAILSGLSFLRLSSDDKRPLPQDLGLDDAGDIPEPDANLGEEEGEESSSGRNALEADRDSSMPWLLYRSGVSKPRRRTGSLRKTALLGTGRFRERRDTLTQIAPAQASPAPTARVAYEYIDNDTPRTSDELSPPPSDGQRTSYDADGETTPFPPLMQSPTSQSNASTDDDEGLSFTARPSSSLPPLAKAPSNASFSSSYFPSPTPDSLLSINDLLLLLRRRTSTTKKQAAATIPSPTPLSPLSALPMDYDAAVTAQGEHSYDETEWWGWVMLMATWIIFVVGMGSCLDVWSWAWDVGQTPYAPPEFQDDPTLPIVGYYPALIILTAVVAWVWVVVAWVGMKYFKHAKIQGDDV